MFPSARWKEKKQELRKRNEKSEQIGESSGKAKERERGRGREGKRERERERESDKIQEIQERDRMKGIRVMGGCKGRSNAVGR